MKLPFYKQWRHVVHGLIHSQKYSSLNSWNEKTWRIVTTSHYGFMWNWDVRIWIYHIFCGWSGILNSHFISNKTRNLGILGWKASVLRSQNWLPGSQTLRMIYTTKSWVAKNPPTAKIQDYSKISFSILIPSGKQTEQWKITILNRKYIFNWWIFHCYVRLPECSMKILCGTNPNEIGDVLPDRSPI